MTDPHFGDLPDVDFADWTNATPGVCRRCGALVENRNRHTAWHTAIEQAATRRPTSSTHTLRINTEIDDEALKAFVERFEQSRTQAKRIRPQDTPDVSAGSEQVREWLQKAGPYATGGWVNPDAQPLRSRLIHAVLTSGFTGFSGEAANLVKNVILPVVEQEMARERERAKAWERKANALQQSRDASEQDITRLREWIERQASTRNDIADAVGVARGTDFETVLALIVEARRVEERCMKQGHDRAMAEREQLIVDTRRLEDVNEELRKQVVVLAERPTKDAYDKACAALEARRIELVTVMELDPDTSFYDAVQVAMQRTRELRKRAGDAEQAEPVEPCPSLYLAAGGHLVQCELARVDEPELHIAMLDGERIAWREVNAVPVPWPKDTEPPTGINELHDTKDPLSKLVRARDGWAWVPRSVDSHNYDGQPWDAVNPAATGDLIVVRP